MSCLAAKISCWSVPEALWFSYTRSLGDHTVITSAVKCSHFVRRLRSGPYELVWFIKSKWRLPQTTILSAKWLIPLCGELVVNGELQAFNDQALIIRPVLEHGPRSSNGTRVNGFCYPKAKWNANILLFVVVPWVNDKLLMLSGICRLQAWCLRPERWWSMPSQDEARGNSGGCLKLFWRANR